MIDRIDIGDDATLYLGDCLDVLPKLDDICYECCIVTDPPYKGYGDYRWSICDLRAIPPRFVGCHGFWFWKGSAFPLPWTSRHIWSKANRNIGRNAEQYEDIYEVNGKATGYVYRHAVIDSAMNATLNGDIFVDHPCQKPERLVRRLVAKTTGAILDPFMGSGTTGVSCIKTGRKFVGIEIDRGYFEIAEKRIRQAIEEQGLFRQGERR